MNYVALWRAANEVKGITSHERQGRKRSGAQDADVIGIDDFHFVDHISVGSVWQNQIDTVSDSHILQPTEKPVSVPRDTHVALLPKSRCPNDSSYATV